MQKEKDLRGDDLEHYEAEIETTNLILIYIPNDIYNFVDACKTTKAMWQRVKRLMRGTVQNKVDRETRFNNEFDQFAAEPGEALVSVYNRFAHLMNDLERNDIIFPKVTVNTNFLNCLQPEWLKAKKLEKSHDPLALVAHTGSSSRTTTPYYVTHPSSVVDYDDGYQGDERTLRTTSSGTTANVQCYNCSEKGHYARNCPKPIVRDSKYFMEQMLLAKQDEAGVILTNKHNDFLLADTFMMEQIKELSANICLMAIIQPTNIDYDVGPSYDSAFLSETQTILKQRMSESEDTYYDTIIDLEARAKKNEDVVLKMGNSLQGMLMLGPKPMSIYDSNVKHVLGYANSYTLKKAISQNLKLYDASCLDDSKIHMNARDTEDILDDATKSQIKIKNKMKNQLAIEKKQNVCTIDYKKLNALYEDFVPQKELSAEQKYFPSSFISFENSSNTSSPYSSFKTKPTMRQMPSANPMLIDLNQMENDFKTLFELLQTNSKRESIFYTSSEEIRLTNFCQQKFKPILHKLHLNFEIFQERFLKDIKEMKDVFVSTENDHSGTWKQNELLKDQL
nr:hypothetical protein [Tanacetum cinerariifolium]